MTKDLIRLPVRRWARSIIEDLHLADEMFGHNIHIAHTVKALTNLSWKIHGYDTFADPTTGRRVLRFYVEAHTVGGAARQTTIWIYTPQAPQTTMLAEFLGCNVIRIRALASVLVNNQLAIIADQVGTRNPLTNRKSSPRSVIPEESLYIIDQNDEMFLPSYETIKKLPFLSRDELVELFATTMLKPTKEAENSIIEELF